MLSEISRRIEAVLLRHIRDHYLVEYEKLNFSTPPRIELGELSLPIAFDLARKVKKSPKDIAGELANAALNIPGIWKVNVAGGGYLNFFLHRGAMVQSLAESIAQNLYGRVGKPDFDGKIVVEHTNINPNKAAHIGHLRNAALGDSFVRCLRFLGHEVEVQNYLDNTGVQVADVVVGLLKIEGKSFADVAALDGRFDYYCWDVYAKVGEFYKRSEENLKWRSIVLQSIEAGNNETAELADHVAMRIVRAHLATMARIDVQYDLIPRESEILHLHFWDRAFKLLQERDAVYFVNGGKNQGCWVMNTESAPVEEGGEERETEEKIIVRSDGTVTYVGKDIAYQLWKFGLLGLDFGYRPFEVREGHTLWITAADSVPGGFEIPKFGSAQRVYNVIDSRQAYLQEIVLQGLKALGYKNEAENSIHFKYEMVALSPTCCEDLGFELSDEDKKRPYIEVSGRRGLGVKADDLLDALAKKALAEVQARHSLPEDQAREIANRISVGALRYFLLRFARNTVIIFDFKEALNFDGETGTYVLYAVVRANNIFRKLQESEAPDFSLSLSPEKLQDFLTRHDDIWELLHQAARLPTVVRQVAQNLELSQLGKYVFHLAQKFNLFYHKYHILSEPDPERKNHLLLVVDVVRKQMEKALDLMGCEIPAKM